jgi:hypothetical protein
MAAPAETDEGRGRVIDPRLAGALPEIPPVVFEGVNVIAGRGTAAVLIGLVGQRRQHVAIRGQGALDPLVVAIEKDHHIGPFVEREPVIGQVIVLRDFFHMLAKPLDRALRAGFLEQCFYRDLPGVLPAAMFTGELVDTALKRLAEAEIIPVQCEHFLAADGVKHPVGQLDLNPQQAAIKAVLAADRRRIDQAEAVALLLLAGADIRGDPCPSKSINRFAESVIVAARGAPVGEDEQIIARNSHSLAHALVPLELLHDLRDAIDQDVFVVNGRKALGARDDFKPVAVMLIPPNLDIPFFRKRIEGMLHLRDQILERRIGHVADEQVAIAMFDRQQVFIRIRGFRCHRHIFVVLGAASSDSWFQVPGGRFVVSGAILRDFKYLGSCFQVPDFGVSGTGHQKSVKRARGLNRFVTAVTLLNTDSNLLNTQEA